MTTTPEEALEAARAYVAENRAYCHVVALFEDERDDLACLGLDPGMHWPIGLGPVFVSKATGKVGSDAYGNVLAKIDRMQP